MSEENMREMGRKLGREIGRAVTLFTAAVMVAAFLFGYGIGLPETSRIVALACMAVGIVIAIAALVVLRIWANSPSSEDE